ncbi:hypothetical protein KDH_15820 [Dictyobacter sp. S3.2.2.5]|uniref:Integral membrane protein YccS N-terminal domain-containing protein n=2 Tax=Dictyobacter halimunensis TaxID=3026934 RepID=A0ABQ6FQE9_9CHLR|nr:hypothetical protein KDH_15820 [Dictyobacter sp. S3.2.2.5]
MTFHFDRSQLIIVRSLVSTFGFILPLAIGVASGHVIEGVIIAGGASSLGGVSLNATHRARVRTMIMASLGIAVSACVGALMNPYPWPSIIAIGLWSFIAGLLVVISQRAMIIGLQSTLALIILTHFNLSPTQALLEALLMFSGALFQVLLSVIPLWQTVGSERNMLANAYQALADYAMDADNISYIRQIKVELKRTEDALENSQSSRNKTRKSAQLLQQAIDIRLALTLFLDILNVIANQDRERYAQRVEHIQQQIEHILRAIAQNIKTYQKAGDLSASYQNLDRLIQEVVKEDKSNYKLQAIERYYKTLRSHLRSAEKLASSLRPGRPSLSWRIFVPRRPRLDMRSPLATLKANLSLESTAFRHAIRLTVVMVIAASIYRFAPIGRGYWIPISALFVLRPDFTSTITRGFARMIGTTCGALAIALLLHFVAPSHFILIILEAVLTFCAYALLFANYSLFSFFITMVIIILLSFVDLPLPQLEFLRTIDTIIGGSLALSIYLLWPTWEHQRVGENIARRLEALQRYYLEVMDTYIAPERYDAGRIEQRRHAAHLERTNVDASVERALSEPELHPFDKNMAQCLLTESDHIAETVLSLEAYLLSISDRPPLPMVEQLSRNIARAMRLFARAIYTEQPAPSIQDIQQQIQELEEMRKEIRQTDPATFTTLSFVLHASRRIITNLQTMNQILTTRHESRKERSAAVSSTKT